MWSPSSLIPMFFFYSPGPLLTPSRVAIFPHFKSHIALGTSHAKGSNSSLILPHLRRVNSFFHTFSSFTSNDFFLFSCQKPQSTLYFLWIFKDKQGFKASIQHCVWKGYLGFHKIYIIEYICTYINFFQYHEST